VRQIILEIGRRLAEDGILEARDDVFYLSLEDDLDRDTSSLRQNVRERKAEMEQFRQIMPPATLGIAPAFDPNQAGPLIRAITKVEGSAFKVEGARTNGKGQAQTVKGQAGSSGVVRGTAKVIHSLAEAAKLLPGDVLVAESTLPPWTPLFATASAVVTDAGGVLSHSAVVAREYRIPAVVGTGRATSTFHDGQLLEVDGDAGTVRVVVEEAEHEPALAG
jgi:phosphohistidine swiveling domain-containing protein